MKKIVLSIAVFFISFGSASSSAGWVEIIKSNTSGNTIYIDPDTIKVINNFVYYYSLTDYKEPVFGDLSVIIHHEAECEFLRERGLNWVFFKGKMGQGKSITEKNYDKEWSYPLTHFSSSSKAIVLKKVCGYIEPII